MADFTLSELAEGAGTGTANFGKNVANRGADFICGLYHDYPGPVLQNPGSSFLKGFWDSLCVGRPAGLPAQPTRMFDGGQCIGVPYVITIGYWYSETDGPYNSGLAVKGPISGVRLDPADGRTAQVLARPSGGSMANPQVWLNVSSLPYPAHHITVQNIARDDGGADNCGNLEGTYPLDPIPANRLQGTTTIVHNDGSNITLPIVYAPIQPSLPITVDVGGVPLKFDLGGVKLGEGDDATDNAALEAQIAELQDQLAGLDAALDRLEQKELLRSEKEKNGALANEDLEDLAEDADQDKEDIDRLAYVIVQLQIIPRNAKNQAGSGGEDVIYAGWFEFKKGINAFPRQPIHFKESVFKAPLGADGFSYTLYAGFTGKSKVIKFKPNQDET